MLTTIAMSGLCLNGLRNAGLAAARGISFILMLSNGIEAAEPATSNPRKTIINLKPQPAPTAHITPQRAEFLRGQKATFTAASAAQGTLPVREKLWHGPGGQHAAADQFVVDTAELAPGDYEITLTVTDRRNRQSVDKAILTVHPNSAGGASGSATSTPARPVAQITPSRRQVYQGEVARFSSRSFHPDKNIKIVRYAWRASAGQTAEGVNFDVTTANLNPGAYTITLEVTDQREARHQARAVLEILTARETSSGSPAVDAGNVAGRRSIDVAISEFEVIGRESFANREVQLRAMVSNRGADLLRNVKVRFETGSSLIAESTLAAIPAGASREARAIWIPPAPGQSVLTVIADPEQRLRDSDRSNNTRQRSLQVRAQTLMATINPAPLEVIQGDEARFLSKISPAPSTEAINSFLYRWRGPSGRVGQESAFAINTRDLQPGRYDISLEISDGQGMKARATTILAIKPSRAVVWLTASNPTPETGDLVRFSGGSRPSFGNTQYKFIYGDGAESEWITEPVNSHSYAAAGEYTARLVARHGNQIVGQQSAKVTAQDVAYTVTLSTDRSTARAGDALTFKAAVTPAAGNLEYQFDFGDGQQAAWSQSTVVSHSYARNGNYAPRAAIRVKNRRVVQSAALAIAINPPPTRWWPWLSLGAAMLVAAGAAYRRWRAPFVAPSFAVIAKTSLENLTVNASGSVHSGCDIAVRGTHGDYNHQIDVGQDHLVQT